MKKKLFLFIFVIGCVCVISLFQNEKAGTFEEKVLGTCGLITEDLAKINVMYVDDTDVQQHSDLEMVSQLQGFSEYFSDCTFTESEHEVFSSHMIQVAAPKKSTWFYLWIDNDGRYLEIQWFGPGDNDGSAVFESDTILSVGELLSAMNID